MTRKMYIFIGLLIIVSTMLTACNKSTATPTTIIPTEVSSEVPTEVAIVTEAPVDPFEFLTIGAKTEGKLVTFGVSDNGLFFSEMSTLYNDKYGIPVENTNKSNSEILAALNAEVTTPVTDVIDLPLSFAKAVNDGGLAQTYRGFNFEGLPDYAKDLDGRWSAAYWGAIAFVVNTDLVKNVPQTWQDLLKPEYKDMICMDDPRKSNSANMAVLAAAYANGGDETNSQPGLDYFKKLVDGGQLQIVTPSGSTIDFTKCPISLTWDFEGLSKKKDSGMNLETVIPRDGTAAGLFIQFIAIGSPHPNAARLMMELMLSDEGQLIYANGFAHPIREDVVLPAELLAKFPPKEDYAIVVFPKDITALAEASTKISDGWGEIVK